MILTQTPLRISLFGGGSDLPAYFKTSHTPGKVLSFAIDKYVYVGVNTKFDGRLRVSYSKTETVDNVNDLEHDLVRESLKFMDLTSGLEITSVSDIPGSGTGLGSSASFTVGLLRALYAHKYLNKILLNSALADWATEIEMVRCGAPIGLQDQYAAAHGGLKTYEFYPGKVLHHSIDITEQAKAKLNAHLLMLYTGTTRSAKDILQKQTENTKSKLATLDKMVAQVDQAATYLTVGNIQPIGPMLHEAWEMKRSLAKGISNPTIQSWYDTAIANGATGGKILGAGGGGFLLMFAPPEKHGNIMEATGLKKVSFGFEPFGSQVKFQS